MSVLWKKNEFYKGESDREVIAIAAGGLREGAESLLQQTGFPIMGALPPIKFFPLPMKVLVPPIVTWNGAQNELILKGTLRKFSACGAYFYENLQSKNLIPSLQQNF